MRLAVISCWEYRDAWEPFFALLEKFWPEHPQAWLLTDKWIPGDPVPPNVQVFTGPRKLPWNWCQLVTAFANSSMDDPILLFQEDFFLTSEVNADLIDAAIEQMKLMSAGSVRLYPCPGGDTDYGDAYFALVEKGSPYRISAQLTLWRPSFLAEIAQRCDNVWDFELIGTENSKQLPQRVLAYKRDVQPWPVQYICTGIVRGKWMPESKRLFEQHGIDADFSLREMHA